MLLRSVVFLAVCGSALSSARADKADLVVVTLSGSAGKSLDRSLVRLIEKPLGQQATLASAAAARKKARLKGKKADTSAGAQALGRAAAVDYVLVLRAGGRGKERVLVSRLVDVASGKTLYVDTDALKGGKLAPATADKIVAQVTDCLADGGKVSDEISLPIDGASASTPGHELAEFMDKQEGRAVKR